MSGGPIGSKKEAVLRALFLNDIGKRLPQEQLALLVLELHFPKEKRGSDASDWRGRAGPTMLRYSGRHRCPTR